MINTTYFIMRNLTYWLCFKNIMKLSIWGIPTKKKKETELSIWDLVSNCEYKDRNPSSTFLTLTFYFPVNGLYKN